MTMRRSTALVATALVVVLALGACSSSGSKSSKPTAPPPGPVLQTIGANADLTSFGTAVGLSDLAKTLAGPGPFTVFAPVNKALVLAKGTLGDPTKPATMTKLTSILSYHVVAGSLPSSKLVDGPLTTLDGQTITIKVTGTDITITDAQGKTAKVVQKDITASNGIIYTIDATLLPK